MDLKYIWHQTQTNLRGQMVAGTYDVTIEPTQLVDLTDGVATVHVDNTYAREWLENRLAPVVKQALERATGLPIEQLIFTNGAGPAPAPQPEPLPQPGRLTIAQRAAAADYHAAWFESGGAGYSMLANYAMIYWSAYLGEAFNLWKRLEIEDKRRLRDIAPNYWTPVSRERYTRLAQALNKAHPRSISGGIVECWHSIKSRTAGDELECCHNPDYAPVKIRPDSAGCSRCLHWQTGLLQTLHAAGLVAVAEIDADNPRAHLLKIQIWRMLPILTPFQVRQLHAQLQTDHARWLAHFGHLANVESVEQWDKITDRTLVPLMPGYELAEIADNFNPARRYEEL